MAIEITIPRLGWNMDEGVFAGWLKRDGEAVRAGEALFSLEGDKATQDVDAIDPGVLKIPASAPVAGDRVAVGAVIGYLLGPGETDVEAEPPRVVAASVPSRRNGPPSTPLARRLARELGVDWTQLRGSGQGGRVRKVDVEAAAQSREKPPTFEPKTRSIPITQARRTIAARMVQSSQTNAPVTLTTTVDATNLVNLRRQFKEAGAQGRIVPGFTDIVVKLTALALRDHPVLNGRWAVDRIELFDEPRIGIAVETDLGLFVPVIHDAATLGLVTLAERARALIERARENRLTPGEMQGGTFTITNLGAFGVEAFTPIINPPESAILGMGRIARLPVMDGDRVVPRDRMTLSLTFDHRVVDGAPAARFLQRLGQSIENPAPWLIG